MPETRQALGRRPVAFAAAISVGALALATVAIAVLEGQLGLSTASSVYLVAVVASALVGGTVAAIATSVASFLLYDFFFIDPVHTLTVRDPTEWLNLLLLLFVGILVGQLAALQRRQTETARAREREATALFRVSRQLATRATTLEALPAILERIRDEVGSVRARLVLQGVGSAERVVADTAAGEPVPDLRTVQVLRRMPAETPAEWVAVHGQVGPTTGGRVRTPGGSAEVAWHRVAVEASGRTIGNLWVARARAQGRPDLIETRLLAATADQIGQALEQDRLAAEAREAEIARRSDVLKSALLESVSHDLRTPLASMRAAAGTLMDRALELTPDERFESAEVIDAEAEYLDRLVNNLLDLSRIEAGSLRAEREIVELSDPVDRAVRRLAPRLGDRRVEVAVDGAPLVEVDPVFLDQILSNLLDNAAKYGGSGVGIRVSAAPDAEGSAVARLTVEDDGPGVPDEQLERLFEKFYRVPGRRGGSRAGTGVGLAVVRGLTEAMGGTVVARRSEAGGLAVDVLLPVASLPGGATDRWTDAMPVDPDPAGGRAADPPSRTASDGQGRG